MSYVYEVCEPFGPVYPALPSVNKHRKANDPSPEGVKAYGQAVRAAIRALQRSEMLRGGVNRSEAKPMCASGTAHTTGKAIRKAVREQNKARACRQDANFCPIKAAKRYHAIMETQRAARQAASVLAYLAKYPEARCAPIKV